MHLYAITSLRSGVFHFDTLDERDAWLAEQGEYGQIIHEHQVDREIRTYFQGQETFTTWGDLKPGDYCEGRWIVQTVEHRDLGDNFGVVVCITTTGGGKRTDFADVSVVVWRHPASPVPGTNLIITDPGKFEGQRSIVEDAYNLSTTGAWTDEGVGGETVYAVQVPVEYRGKVPSKFETVRFIEDEQGFIVEVKP